MAITNERQFLSVVSHRTYFDLNVAGASKKDQQTIQSPLNYDYNDPNTDLVVITGFAETYTNLIAQRLGELGISAAVCNLEYSPEVKVDEDIIEQTILKGITSLVESVNEVANRPLNTPLNFAGHSIGFAKQGKFAIHRPDLVAGLTGSAPFGFNTQLSYRDIMGRLKGSGVEVDIDKISGTDRKQLFHELKSGSAYINRQDTAGYAKHLWQAGILKRFIIGEDDPLCPPKECEDILGSDEMFKVTSGGHNPLDSQIGLDQLVEAISMIQND